ncbi:hypothetical protein [Leptolyngbya ohadii]|nr:hypothetical protein [Leptolyngbya ohadii]
MTDRVELKFIRVHPQQHSEGHRDRRLTMGLMGMAMSHAIGS